MFWCLFRLTKNDLEKIASEHANYLSTDDFIKMYHEVQSKGKHEFLIIDYKAPMENRFRHRFTKILHPLQDAKGHIDTTRTESANE